MVEILGKEHLEMPLSSPDGTDLFAGHRDPLREQVNEGLQRNWQRIDVFTERLRSTAWRSTTVPPRSGMTDVQQTPTSLAKKFEERKRTFLAKSSLASWDDPVIDLCAEINRHPALFTTSSCSGRSYVRAQAGHFRGAAPSSSVENWRMNHKAIEDTTYFLTDSLLAPSSAASSTEEGSRGHVPAVVHWLRLEPFVLRICCRDLVAAAFVIAAAGTIFKKAGLFAWKDGCWLLEVWGAERLEIPLTLPNGAHPFAGREEWLRELVNRDLQKTWDKTEQFLRAIKAASNRSQEDSTLLQ